jgi:predicted RNA polymerase sigma factor
MKFLLTLYGEERGREGGPRAHRRARAGPRALPLLPRRAAGLLCRLGADDAAEQAYEQALALAGNAAERAFLERRILSLRG